MPDRARVLVVYCHPCEESYCAALRDAVCDTLRADGHEVDLLDLHAERFDPVMWADERRAYHDAGPNLDPIRDHAERIARAEAMIFVYPTWWFAPPAMLKGWLDRVFVPGFAFLLPDAGHGPRPGLQHIRHLGVVTSGGANWLTTLAMGFPGRRIFLTALRANCHPLVRTGYSAIYKMDTASEERLARHLETIPPFVRRLMRPRRRVRTTGPAPEGLARRALTDADRRGA